MHLSIDDIQKYSINTIGIFLEYFSTNLINSKYYTFFVKFWQIVGGYQFTLSWNYPSQSSFSQIPMKNIFLPSLVSNSPYTINSAATVWGDGKRTGVETWDDGNVNSGDGWSSAWIIESGYTWSRRSSTSKDICSIIFVVTAQEAAAAKSTQAAIGAGASVSVGASLLSVSSPLGVFSILNQFQLLYILLASGVYVSDGVFNLIIGMSFALFDFNFINIKEIKTLNFIYSYLSIQQVNASLNKIGFIK